MQVDESATPEPSTLIFTETLVSFVTLFTSPIRPESTAEEVEADPLLCLLSPSGFREARGVVREFMRRVDEQYCVAMGRSLRERLVFGLTRSRREDVDEIER